MKAIVMPALGVAMSEGTLIAWLKRPGDAVRKGEPVMEIETDKTTVEVESPCDGFLGAHLFRPGAAIPVGVEMTRVLEPTDATSSADASPAVEAPAGPDGHGQGQTPAALASDDGPGVTRGTDHDVAPGQRAPSRLSPRERRLARERELAGGARPQAEGSDGQAPVVARVAASGKHRELIAAKVAESWRTIPHFAVVREVDASAMQALRARWADDQERPSLTDLMLRALALALRDSGEPGPIDVGLAVATPHGVAIPVIRGVLALDWGSLRRERTAAVARARDGRLLPADLANPPRATLSNLGLNGVDSFTGVIALGQMSLLTVGRVAARPWVANRQLTVRDSFPATLNVDHRYLDGEDAARMLMAFTAAAENAALLEKEAGPA